MMSASHLRASSRLLLPRRVPTTSVLAPTRRSFAVAAARRAAADPAAAPAASSELAPQTTDQTGSTPVPLQQAPNRAGIWTRNQQPREKAMTGPRFEQTDFSLQPQPYSGMALIHEQPVRWTHDRVVSCDGGGGPAGHPRIFINTDKAQISSCTYCGTPYANEHHRKYLESLPATPYPLSASQEQ